MTVRIGQGQLSGTVEHTQHGSVRRYAGVPYGAAPLGALRFGAPQAAPAWEGTLAAADFGPAPMQAQDGMLVGTVPGMRVASVSEDCLTLTIWVPEGSGESLPVLVWIYGGAFMIGGTSAESYDGAALAAEQQVVVVSINYRVGAFGFLDLRQFGGDEIGAVTNVGLRDQLLGVRWVHDNIAAFGGDPATVTVFGESAGAGSIVHLISAPGMTQVARRAIAQSPGVDFTQHPDASAVIAGRLLRQLGVSAAKELLDIPAEQLVAAEEAVSLASMVEYGAMVFHPVLDGDVVPHIPSLAVDRGDAAGIDLLIGSTADEMRLYLDPRANDIGAPGLVRWATEYTRARMGGQNPPAERIEQLVAGYVERSAGTSRPNPADVWAALMTDGTMRLPALRIADAQSAHNPATFVYGFTWQSRHPDADRGAFHAVDIPFAFDTFDRGGWGDFVGIDDAGRTVAFAMRSAWAAFARTGNPSTDVTGPWPAYEPRNRATMILGVPFEVAQDPLADQRRLWDGLWNADCRAAGFPT